MKKYRGPNRTEHIKGIYSLLTGKKVLRTNTQGGEGLLRGEKTQKKENLKAT